MKIEILDDNNFVLYIINKSLFQELDEEKIADTLKNLFLKIKKDYNFDIYGYYDVFINNDLNYGKIIRIIKDEDECYNYYSKQIEMKIIISNNIFLYKVKDLFNINKKIIDLSNIYLYKNDYYLELKENVNFILLGSLLENSKVIYEDLEQIKKNSEKIEIR